MIVSYVDPEIIPRGLCGRQCPGCFPPNITVPYLKLITELILF